MSIILDNISYYYDSNSSEKKKALSNINLKIDDGEMIGIIGHTGSGKSTLVQHLNGLIKASNGAYYYNGEDVYDKDYNLKNLRNKVGLVFQYPEYQLFEETVIKDVSYGPTMQGLELLEVQLRAFESLKLLGIDEEYLDASPLELSGGQKRKVAIAGVLAMKPDVLVLDEPTAGLDPYSRKELLNIIKGLHRETGMTVVIVSHSMEEMAEYVDRLIVMNEGRIEYDDTPEKVFANYEELKKMGLDVPESVKLINELRNEGYLIPYSNCSVKSIVEDIARYFKNDMNNNL